MKELHLNIVSPEMELYDGVVSRITLPGALGSFTILPHHAPIVSALNAGKVVFVTADGTERSQEIQGGFMEMSNNRVSVCID